MERFALLCAFVMAFGMATDAHAQATTAAMCDVIRQQASDERDLADQEYAAASGVVSSANFYMGGANVWIRYNTPTVVAPGVTSVPPWQTADAAYGRGEYALAYPLYVESYQKAQVARRLVQAAVTSP